MNHQFSQLLTLGTIQIVGGSSVTPVGFGVARDAAFGFQNKLVQQQNQQAESQTLAFQNIQIGGNEAVYFDESAISLSFPNLADAAAKRLQFHVPAGTIGLIIDASDGDTVKLENSSVSGGAKWNFTLASGISTAATYSFQGLQIINANVSLQPLGYAIGGMTFDSCAEIIHNGADLSGGNTISNSTALLEAITISDQADLDKLANCTFDGNVIAILVEGGTTRTLTADNIKFLNNQIDIEYNGSGTLTWVNTNGADAAIVDVFDGNVTIETPSTLTLSGLIAGTEVRVFEAGTTTEVTGDEAIAGTTFVANINSATVPSVDIAIISLGYINIRLLSIDLTGGDVSIPVSQRADRQYENP